MANRILDYLTPYKIRVIDYIGSPILTATPEGTTGSTIYRYAATIRTQVGESLPSETVIVTDGNATLNGFNKIKLSVTDIPETALGVRYWKNDWSYGTQTVRQNATFYDVNDYVVLAANSELRYKATVAGISNVSLPSDWPTEIGGTIEDGGVAWVCETNIIDNWELLAEVTAAVGQLYDTGQSVEDAEAVVPSTDTSGRPDVVAIGCKTGTLIQRQTWEDLQGIYLRLIQDLGDMFHKNGDIRSGCKEFFKSGTTWGFTSGKIYFMGAFVSVPEGEITLTGSGEEKVGLTVTPYYSTSNDDPVQRASADEGVFPRHSNVGPDWLYLTFQWVKDTQGMILVKEFLDNAPKKVSLVPERTELDIYIADKIKDLSGDVVIEKFPLVVEDHPSDSTKLRLSIKRGKAYPNGFKTVIEGERSLVFEKARDVASDTDSTLDAFNAQGSSQAWTRWQPDTEYNMGAIVVAGEHRYEVTARAGDYTSGSYEPIWPTTPSNTVIDNNVTWTCMSATYNLDGLTLTVKSGSGNTHTVTFTSAETTPSTIVTKIETVVNADVTIVDASASTYLVAIRNIGVKSLTLGGTSLAELGWSSGTTTFDGSRVYFIGEEFVRGVAEGVNETLSYLTEVVSAVTRSNVATKDFIDDDLATIIGAADAEADCHDGIFGYTINNDFIKEGDYIQWAGLSANEPTAGHTYYVKWLKQHVASRGVRQLCNVVDSTVVRGESDLDNLRYTGATITRALNGDAVSITGDPKDVVRILSVRSAPNGGGTEYSGYTLVSNSDALGHATSQISWAGVTVGSKPNAGTTYYVTYEVWYHQIEGDYVAANSYDMYERIGVLGNYSLRDCVDFRTTTVYIPAPNAITTLDYSYYLPRTDKVMVDDLGNFYLVKGVPGKKPGIPNDQDGRLSLAILRIAPYTYSKEWVNINWVAPTVIQQRDLKLILERLDRLEYWKATTDLEREVLSSDVSTDAVGLYTNALTGVGKFDLGFRKTARVGDEYVEIKHTAALDIQKQCLLLPASPDMKALTLDAGHSSGYKRVGNTIVLDYTPVPFLTQPFATDSVNLAMDYDYDNYRGTAQIYPASDSFIDREQLPTVHMDFDNNLQPLVDALVDQGALSLNETIWSQWHTSYTNNIYRTLANTNGGWAYSYDPVTGEYTSGNVIYGYGDRDAAFEQLYSYVPNRSRFFGGPVAGIDSSRGMTTQHRWRDGVSRSLVPGTTTESLGSSMVDMAMVGKARTKYPDNTPFYIQVEVFNLMPNQDHAVTVSGKPVDFTYGTYPGHPSAPSTRGGIGTHTYSFGGSTYTTVKSDNTGRLTGYFTMPSGVDAGNIPIQVFLYSDYNASNASVYFTSAGFATQSRETTIGMPTFNYHTEEYHEEETRTIYYNYYDPLAQTFVVYDTTRYISEVDVYFRTKHNEADPTKALGVRLEIRNTVNGEPGPTILATSRKEASEIATSETAHLPTRFELDTVLGYTRNNEFCVVMFPDLNNTHYEVWTAKVGNIDVLTGQRVTAQTNDGILFHSPNNRVWEPMTTSDLKFTLYHCNFVPECTLVFENISGVSAGSFVAALQEVAAAGSDVKWYYSIDAKLVSDASKVWLPFYPNIDTYATSLITDIDIKCDVVALDGSYQLINPESGIVFMLHKDEAWAVMPNSEQDDDLLYPNTVKCYVNLDSNSDVSIIPYFSFDDGVTLVEIAQDSSFTPTVISGNYYKTLYSTPEEITIETASADTPIRVTSTNHNFKENAKVFVSGVAGNAAANGTFVIRGVTANTFDLYDVATKEPIIGVGSGTGGTAVYAEMSQCRPFIKMATTNNIRTPRLQDISFILSKV